MSEIRESLQIDPKDVTDETLPEKQRAIVCKLRAPNAMVIAIADKVASTLITMVNDKTPFLIALSVGPDCKSGIKPGDRFIAEAMMSVAISGATVIVTRDDRMLVHLPKADMPKEGILGHGGTLLGPNGLPVS